MDNGTDTQQTPRATVGDGRWLTLTDRDGDSLFVNLGHADGVVVRTRTGKPGDGRSGPLAELDRDHVMELYSALGDWLYATAERQEPTVEIGGQVMTQAQYDAARRPLLDIDPGGTCDEGPCCNTQDGPVDAWLSEMPPPSILDDARMVVYGRGEEDYGHPRRNFTRAAVIWQGLLMDKLADGEHITPEDVGRCMIGLKLARDVNSPKRDNRVDIAGFAETLDRLETGR